MNATASPKLRLPDSLLVQLAARGSRAWPQFSVRLPRFAAHLERTAGGAVREALAALAIEDLYLACACLEGLPEALAALERTHLGPLERTLSRLNVASDLVQECVQILRGRLLFGEGERRPLLAEYAGRGSLKSWLTVTATRDILAFQARQAREVSLGTWDLPHQEVAGGPELAALRLRFQQDFPAAFRAALASLTPRQRNLLRYAYQERLSIDRLGAIYGTHRATAARWLSAARESLAAGVRQRLGASFGMGDEECASLLRLVVSALDASLPGALELTASSPRLAARALPGTRVVHHDEHREIDPRRRASKGCTHVQSQSHDLGRPRAAGLASS